MPRAADAHPRLQQVAIRERSADARAPKARHVDRPVLWRVRFRWRLRPKQAVAVLRGVPRRPSAGLRGTTCLSSCAPWERRALGAEPTVRDRRRGRALPSRPPGPPEARRRSAAGPGGSRGRAGARGGTGRGGRRGIRASVTAYQAKSRPPGRPQDGVTAARGRPRGRPGQPEAGQDVLPLQGVPLAQAPRGDAGAVDAGRGRAGGPATAAGRRRPGSTAPAPAPPPGGRWG